MDVTFVVKRHGTLFKKKITDSYTEPQLASYIAHYLSPYEQQVIRESIYSNEFDLKRFLVNLHNHMSCERPMELKTVESIEGGRELEAVLKKIFLGTARK